MDVTCARCGTEYEFEDTLLAPTGTPVRCGQCSHAFRVMPARHVPAGWRVKRDDGIHVTIASLTDLRERIRRGELAEQDQIARPGEDYKRLGDIAELRSTFESARTAVRPVPRPVERRPNYDVTERQGKAAMATRVPQLATSEAPARAAPEVTHESPTVEIPRPPPVPRLDGRPRLRLAIEDEPPPRPPRSKGPWVAAAVGLLGAFGAYQALDAYQQSRDEHLTEAVEPLRAALRDDTYASYRVACAALADLHREDPAALAPLDAVARCELRWADALEDEATVERDGSRSASLRSLAGEHREEGLRFARAAVERDPTANAAALITSVESGTGSDGGPEGQLARARFRFARDNDTALLDAELARLEESGDARPSAARLALAVRGGSVTAVERASSLLRERSPEHPLLLHADRALRALRADGGLP